MKRRAYARRHSACKRPNRSFFVTKKNVAHYPYLDTKIMASLFLLDVWVPFFLLVTDNPHNYNLKYKLFHAYNLFYVFF